MPPCRIKPLLPRALLTVILLLSAAEASLKDSYRPMDGEGFRLYAVERDSTLALRMMPDVAAILNEYQRFFATPAGEGPIVHIYVVDSRQHFFEEFQQRVPEWAGALYVPSVKGVLLKSMRWHPQPARLMQDLRHELSHYFCDIKFHDNSIPLWYNEGLAEWLSRDAVDFNEGRQFSNSIWLGKQIQLKDIRQHMGATKESAGLAYTAALLAVEFLMEKLPENSGNALNHFHRSILQIGWAAALEGHTGLTEIQFQEAWENHVRSKFSGLFFWNIELLISLSFVLLFILAFIRIRRRNRRRLADLD